MTQPPPRLYKYFGPTRQSFLDDWRVRFTQPAALNDPFEMRPHIAGFSTPERMREIAEQRWDQFARDKYDCLVRTIGPLQTFEEFHAKILKDKAPMMEESLQRLSEHNPAMAAHIDKVMNEGVGVLSLCEHPDSLLMWAHYGQEHRGYVVEFDTAAPFFNQKEPPKHVKIEEGDAERFAEEYGGLRKIRYADERPSLLVSEMIFDAVMTKGSQWAYEDEWRMLMPPDYVDQKVDAGQRLPVCLFAVPPSAVTRIIVGSNAADDLIQHVMHLRGRVEARHISIERARTDYRHFTLMFEAIA